MDYSQSIIVFNKFLKGLKLWQEQIDFIATLHTYDDKKFQKF